MLTAAMRPSSGRPDASSHTSAGAPTTPTMQVSTSAHSSTDATASTRRCVASSPSRTRVAASSGTKACENAPSAKRRRSRLGMRKATQKASVSALAPKSPATSCSRTKPVMREASVSRETVEAARKRLIGDDQRAGRGGANRRIIGSVLYFLSLVRHVVSLSPAAGQCSTRVGRNHGPDHPEKHLRSKADAVTERLEVPSSADRDRVACITNRHKRPMHDVGRRVQLLPRAIKSLIVLSCSALAEAVTCCAINRSLGWHAELVTALCEAHPTTSPTSVAWVSREGTHGLCQQEGG